MKYKRFFLVGIVLLAFIGMVTFYLIKSPFPFLWERVRIPNSELSIQIPIGYEYLGDKSLWILDEVDSIGAETTYPAFWIFPTSHTDDYRTYQAPEDVLAKVFQDDFEEPQKQTIQGVDIYLARYIGAPTEKEIQVVKALLFHNNQYIIFDAVGLTSETDRLYTMAEAMLNSLRIEEN